MQALLKLARMIDAVNERIGKLIVWLVLISVLISAGNAVMRKAFDLSSNALLEIQWYLFSAIFLLGASWTLLRNEHIRIDIISGRLSSRAQNWIDVFGIVFFLLPMARSSCGCRGRCSPWRSTSGEMSSNPRRADPLAGTAAGAGRLLHADAAGPVRTRSSASPSCAASSPTRWKRQGADARGRTGGSHRRRRRETRNDRLHHRQHGADHVRGAGRLPAARFPGRPSPWPPTASSSACSASSWACSSPPSSRRCRSGSSAAS